MTPRTRGGDTRATMLKARGYAATVPGLGWRRSWRLGSRSWWNCAEADWHRVSERRKALDGLRPGTLTGSSG